MSRYIMIRRLRGPAILLLIGVLALLHQMGALPRFWHLFWPLLLILLGIMMLAERAALATEGYPMFPGWPWHSPAQGAPGTGEGWRGGWQDASHAAGQSGSQSSETAIVPSEPHDLAKHSDGEQS